MQMLPLTQAQAAIWYAQQKTGDGRPYQIGGSVRIQGEIDFALLRAALEDLVRENEGLRQQFCVRNGRASGYFVSPEQTAQMGWKDFLQSGDPRREFEAWAHTQLNSPFLLIDSPLYAFTIFRITRQETGYFIKLHHLIADGWSVELITKRVARAYEERLRGDRRTRHFPSYADYVAAEQSLLCSDQLERQTGFWVDRLSPPPEIAALDGDVVGQASRTTLYPAVARMDALRHAADEWGVSINAVWIALVCLYQYKKHGQTDVVLGLPLLGRAGRIEREMIGTFTNTMPLRLRINRSVSVRELIETVDRELGECYRRQKAPYSQLLARLQAAYHGVERLYDICVNCYNTVPAESIGGLPAVNTEYPRGAQEYSLQMILRSWNGGIFQIDYDYRLDCVSREGVDRMHCQLMLLLDQVVASPEQPVEKLGLLSSEEFQHMVYDWNQTVSPFPKKETVLDRIVREAERFPERAAILFADQSWCYRQLLFQVRRYAAWLWRQGARPGMVIGLAAEHTPQCLAGALAILWCGCIYQPLDPSDPPSRIGELLAASGAAYMVTYRRQRLHHLSTIALEDAPDALQETESPRARPSEAAYCITTSGSTGRPKGVMVSHRSIMNYLWWARGRYLTAERESFVLYSSFAFDFTMTSFLLPLLCGQEVRLYPGQREDNVFQRIFRQGEVTVLKITPSHIPLLLDALPAPPSLHTLILGGENLPGHQCAALADALGGRVRIWNEYGPTEATVGCMIHQYEKKDARRDYVPLGRPIANTRVYLLDEDGMPVPGDRVGEIVVGGEGVAMGYRHNPDETDRCFISDPFAEGKAYRTGDLARWQSDGVMIMVGRRDEEIKIRGHRVCLAEIERCIVSSGLADNARVVVRQVGGERLLCAYLTGSDGTGQIREYCVLHLPDYLVPQWFCVVERLPITRRGKLDLEGLPLPDPANRKSSDAQPLSEDIKLLIRVMQTVLEGEIGAQDNFYALGGDSIKAIQIASRLNEQGFSLKVGDILRNPVLSQMAQYMRSCDAPEPPEAAEGEVSITPSVRWFLDQRLPLPGQYNQSMLLRLLRPLTASQIGQALDALVKHHDALRLNLDEDGRLFYNSLHRRAKIIVEEAKIHSLEEIQSIQTSFHLSKDLLLRGRLLRMRQERYLFLTLHHLVVDGVSWRILLDDLALLLSQQERGEPMRLPPKSDSYQTFARMLPKRTQQHTCASAPQGFLRDEAHTVRITLPRELTASLVARQGRPDGESVQSLLLAALYRALRRIGFEDPILIEREGHGREQAPQARTQRTVGWFTTFEKNWMSEDDREGKKRIRFVGAAPGHEVEKKSADMVRFNYLGGIGTQANDFFEPLPELWRGDVAGCNRITCRLCADILLAGGQLKAYITFHSEDLLSAKLPACFLEELEAGSQEALS